VAVTAAAVTAMGEEMVVVIVFLQQNDFVFLHQKDISLEHRQQQ
jgi:hypothetical protein